jgi:glycosyltransferase involved in cell wall biosynthesis
MADRPFSLLLPVYAGDTAEHFREAFRTSVVDQELRPDDVVVVRDGPVSPDLARALAEVVDGSPVEARLVPIEINGGLAAALEVGLDACRHEIVARMDADDLSFPTRFARQLEALGDDLDLVGAGMVEFAGDLGTIVGRRVPRTAADIAPYARFHDPFNHPTVVYRKPAVRAAGGYQPLGLMEDYWLFARMIHNGARVDNVPEPLLGYRVDEGAYRRRGGVAQLRAEIRLQRELRKIGFTTPGQFARNLAVRGGYRLVPSVLRRAIYRRFVAGGRPEPTS